MRAGDEAGHRRRDRGQARTACTAGSASSSRTRGITSRPYSSMLRIIVVRQRPRAVLEIEPHRAEPLHRRRRSSGPRSRATPRTASPPRSHGRTRPGWSGASRARRRSGSAGSLRRSVGSPSRSRSPRRARREKGQREERSGGAMPLAVAQPSRPLHDRARASRRWHGGNIHLRVSYARIAQPQRAGARCSSSPVQCCRYTNCESPPCRTMTKLFPSGITS